MKSLKAKRILSTALAGTMALSLAATAFAADPPAEPEPTNTKTDIEATYTEIPIAVTVPKTGKAFINPYGLPVDVGALSTAADDTDQETISGQQITTMPVAIQNNGEIKLKVGATVLGTVTGNTKLVASAEAIDGKDAVGSPDDADYVPAVPAATSNSAFVYLQMKGTTGAVTDATDADLVQDEIIKTATAAAWSSAYTEATDVILGTKAVTKEGIVTLNAATVASGAPTAYPAGSIAVFRLAGKVVTSPKTPWAKTDGFNANIAFTFVPDLTT